MTQFDLAVVGAGPAGLSAARIAAAHGLRVAVFDEQQRAGGQIFRRRPVEFADAGDPAHHPYRWAPELLAWADHAYNVSWHLGACVLGVLQGMSTVGSCGPGSDDGLQIVVSLGGSCRVFRARRLLVATGAYDMPAPVPDWTLPGVMTLAGAQSLVSSQGILPGRRIVLAGSHPLLILAAERLIDAGAQVAEVLVARGIPRPAEVVAALPAIPGHVRVVTQAVHALRTIRRAGVPVTPHHLITRILGDDAVVAVEVSPVDARWRVCGPPRSVEADTVLVGFGFSPMTDLARQMGCEMIWRPSRGGWVVHHDALMRTTVPNVYVAGEPTGIAGAEQARAGGQVAGLAIVADAGARGRRMRIDRWAARRRWRRAVRFSRVVQRWFEPNLDALLEIADDRTIVCRCELVRKAHLDETLRRQPFITSLNAAKLYCRVGMGPCQGRYCESTISGLVARESGVERAALGYYSAQLPVRPVPVGALADLNEAPCVRQ